MKESSAGSIRVRRYKELGNLEVIWATDVLHSLPRHMHRTMCAGIIDAGARVCLYKRTKHTIVPGQVLFLNAGEVHTCSSASGKPYSYRMVCLEEDFLRAAFKESACSRMVFPSLGEIVLRDGKFYEQIDKLTRNLATSGSILEQESAFYSFMAHLLRVDESAGTTDNREHQAIALVKEYLEAHCAGIITLNQLAALVNLSPYYLNRVFTRVVGLPPHAYQYLIRIRRAKGLLACGSPQTEAALETGFVDQSHFQKWFKKTVGITPGQYCAFL